MPRMSIGPQSIDSVLNEEPEEHSNTGPFAYKEYPCAVVVLNFIKSHLNPRPRIQLITTSASPLELVLRFHSSKIHVIFARIIQFTLCSACVMNMITHDKAYSIFPWATFEERRSLIHVKDLEVEMMARLKYEGRGWQFINGTDVNESRDRPASFIRGPRQLGDSRCWMIQLHPAQDPTPNMWESNSWSLNYDAYENPTHVWMLLKSPRRLHFSYLVDSALVHHIKTIDFNKLELNENER